MEERRPVGHDPVEVLAPRCPAREVGHRPAFALDPGPVRVVRGVAGDHSEVGVETTQVAQVAAERGKTARHRMDVGIAEAGDDHPAMQLDHPRGWADQALDVVTWGKTDDAAAPRGHAGRPTVARLPGPDPASG